MGVCDGPSFRLLHRGRYVADDRRAAAGVGRCARRYLGGGGVMAARAAFAETVSTPARTRTNSGPAAFTIASKPAAGRYVPLETGKPMDPILFALMRAFGFNYGEARDVLVGAYLGDVEALRAVCDVTPLGTID